MAYTRFDNNSSFLLWQLLARCKATLMVWFREGLKVEVFDTAGQNKSACGVTNIARSCINGFVLGRQIELILQRLLGRDEI